MSIRFLPAICTSFREMAGLGDCAVFESSVASYEPNESTRIHSTDIQGSTATVVATEVWAEDHRRASVAEALGRHERRRQRHLRAVADEPVVDQSRLDLGAGDFDVDEPDLSRYVIDDEETGA